MSEEDEELEKLRAAALQTLRKRVMPDADTTCISPSKMAMAAQPPLQPLYQAPFAKRGRGFNSSRTRNGQFNGRIPTNLISIPTLESPDSSAPPLDKGALVRAKEQTGQDSKFSRYDNDDEDLEDSDGSSRVEEAPRKPLTRSSSLEALMQELEYEISGGRTAHNGEPAASSKQEVAVAEAKTLENKPRPQIEPLDAQSDRLTNNGEQKPNWARETHQAVSGRRFILPTPAPVVLPPPIPYSPQGEYVNAVANSFDSAAFVLNNREIIEKRKRSPRRPFSRSPSPRPRRSKSRSPRKSHVSSPHRHPQASASPKTSARPANSTRGPRASPPSAAPHRTRSPLRRDPPRERRKPETRPSPRARKQESPKNVEADAQPQTSLVEARRRKAEPPKEIDGEVALVVAPEPPSKEVANEEPVSLIKREPTPPLLNDPDDLDTLDLNIDIDFDTNLDDIFSDDESDDGNEGRFKSVKSAPPAGALPFSELMNSSLRPTKSAEEPKCERRRHRAGSTERRERSNHRSRQTEARHASKRRADESSTWRKRDFQENIDEATAKAGGKREHEHRSSSRRSSRVEGKSSKRVEKSSSDELMVRKDDETPTSRQLSPRKLPAARTPIDMKKLDTSCDDDGDDDDDIDDDDDDDVVVTVIDNDDDHNGKKAEGDLRVQLSRKRAERQHKTVMSTEDVQQRLLHNALGAVFPKSKKLKRADRDDDEAAPKDKPPIHQRLGFGKEKEELSMKAKKKYRDNEQV